MTGKGKGMWATRVDPNDLEALKHDVRAEIRKCGDYPDHAIRRGRYTRILAWLDNL